MAGLICRAFGWPATTRLTERITRPTFGRLAVDLTVDDPEAYTRSWTVRLELEFAADVELVEEVCLEGLKPMR